jgi:predicted ATPase
LVARTDGVPLYVEEITKTVLESEVLHERDDGYELTGPLPPLAIPATLHDALMARLDRLATVKAVAQLGAAIGRQFSYALLSAVAPWDEAQLLLMQRGIPPQATYTFKHALIRDAAYQSVLKRTRQHYHQRIAQVLEAQFPEVMDTQPELVAYHYTEAERHEPAVAYWHQAGQRALQRTAYTEAIAHFTTGLAVLNRLPETPERLQRALDGQIILGTTWMERKGYGAEEVEQAFIRARELCHQLQLDTSPRICKILPCCM